MQKLIPQDVLSAEVEQIGLNTLMTFGHTGVTSQPAAIYLCCVNWLKCIMECCQQVFQYNACSRPLRLL